MSHFNFNRSQLASILKGLIWHWLTVKHFYSIKWWWKRVTSHWFSDLKSDSILIIADEIFCARKSRRRKKKSIQFYKQTKPEELIWWASIDHQTKWILLGAINLISFPDWSRFLAIHFINNSDHHCFLLCSVRNETY